MKIAVWRTGHEIADRVAQAIRTGFDPYCGKDIHGNDIIEAMPLASVSMEEKKPWLEWADIHIAYGILRGADEVFRWCQSNNKPWLCLDRGYWKPHHYDGYYRVSLCGTQQTTGLDKLEPDYERWDNLGIEIKPSTYHYGKPLFCPPTDYVKTFFGLNEWQYPPKSIVREKGCARPLQDDLDHCSKVITFNSSVGWEALRQGIDVKSDPNHSIVGAYQKLVDFPLCSSYDERRRLFGIMASLQLTLAEISEGKLWPLINRLMFISAGTGVKQ